MKRPLVIGLVSAAAVVATALPAQAMTPRTPGWSPFVPPSASELALLQEGLPQILYTVTCGGLTATGWSADAFDDTVGDWDTVLVTTPSVARACLTAAPTVQQGDDTFEAKGWNSAAPAGLVLLTGERYYADWDFVPSPRVGQWLAVGARGASAQPLDLLQRRVAAVGDDTFTLDQAVDADYVGAPVMDNRGRVLGVMSQAGIEVTGTPQFCAVLFDCTDPTRVWWDITAPSKVTRAKAVGAKGSVVVTWGPVADDGGAEVAYWYHSGDGVWKHSDAFRVVIKARARTKVQVTIVSINDAGPGPSTTVTARAK